MAGIADFTENASEQMEMARRLGESIGAVLGNEFRERRRKTIQTHMVALLSQGAGEGRDGNKMRLELLQIPKIMDTQFGQELIQAQIGIDPLDTEYKQAQIEASKARTDYYNRRQGGFGGLGSGVGAAGQGNLLAIRKYWTDELKKAVDVAANKHPNDMEAAYKDPTVVRIQKRIDGIDRQMVPMEEGRPYAGLDINKLEKLDHELSEGMQPPPPTDSKDAFPTAEELIGPPISAQRDVTMQGAFGKPGLVGPPASAQTSFPVTPSLEKRSSPARPKTKEEFLATVARLKASPDMAEKARAYYEKWIGEFKWR